MKGWEVKKLGDVIVPSGTIDPTKTPDRPFRYVDVSSVSNESFDIQDAQELLGRDAPSRARRRIKAGDVIFATIRPTLKRVAIVPRYLDNQVCSTGYFVFRTKPFLDQRFLFHFLLTDDFMASMERLQAGASYPAVNDSQVRQQEIHFPTLSEQRRIVAILDEAFAGLEAMRANAEKNLQNARDLFEAYHNSIFSQRHDDWKEKSLGDVCEYVNGKAHEQCIDENGQFIVINSKFIASEGKLFKSSNQALLPLNPGDITMVLSDVPNGKALAKCFIVEEADTYTLNQRICLIRSTKFNAKFLFHQLNRNKYFLAFDNGENQTNLRLNQVLSCPLYLPPLAGQHAIAVNLDTLMEEVQRLEAIYRQKLAAVAELKQSILQKAFSGQLISAETIAA